MLAVYAVSPVAPKINPVKKSATTSFDKGLIRYHYEIAPNKPTILLLHGFNNQLSSWDSLTKEISSFASILRLDIPGYGESDWSTNDYTLPTQAKRIVVLLDQLEIKKVHIAGGSMGGSLTAWIAAHYPERVHSALLMAPSGYPDSLLYPGLFGLMVKPGLVNKLAFKLTDTPFYQWAFPKSKALQATSVTSSYGEPWKAALPNIKAPTVIMWSVGDYGVPFEKSTEVNKLIPNSILLSLPKEVGHAIGGKSSLTLVINVLKQLIDQKSLSEIANSSSLIEHSLLHPKQMNK